MTIDSTTSARRIHLAGIRATVIHARWEFKVMTRLIALVITLVFAVPVQAQTRAIRFGKLWDGSKVITDAVVVVDGERITSVGTGNSAVPGGAQVIDLRKYFGLPGLIDLHTHNT